MKIKTFLITLFAVSLVFVGCMNSGKKKEAETKTEEVTYEPNYVGNEVTYSNDSITMKGYIAFDENATEKKPGVLVVHEWWGHNDYSRQRADMLAELGYTALAVDMYGDGKNAEHPEDAGKFAGMVMSNMPSAKSRFMAAMNELKNHPSVDPDNIAAIGYCFGGSVVLTMANAGMDLDAVAAFHSGVGLPVMPNEDLKAKVLVCNGADDPFIAPESVEAFKVKMDSINADYKYIAYEGAKHSFTSKEANANGEKFGLPLEYNAEADQKSWQELQNLLNEVF
ncbi:dienelactone hydrolase family protein [Croceivirga thetidis]|uniref:Dienelactone hydrolase family protein n=1 Tax=Croceivirga thetidis TaxID=2721623 RepID=A0ABX1GQW5_9FLAO|nr:dienelactone hydrolase family protein [Croceivirga thetidis]NKI32311.1 dienelactone hydrolase family protein [Croceivirga thetidis]